MPLLVSTSIFFDVIIVIFVVDCSNEFNVLWCTSIHPHIGVYIYKRWVVDEALSLAVIMSFIHKV